MIGARDIGWAVGLCAVLVVLVQCRAGWSAEDTVERDAEQGFLQAYDGARVIEARRFELIADRQNLTGRAIEVVARQVITLATGVPGGEDASQEVHCKLERKGTTWVYTLFETRDGQRLDDPGSGNPWARTLLARAAARAPTPEPSTGAPGPPPGPPPGPATGD